MRKLVFVITVLSFQMFYAQNDSVFIRKTVDPFSENPVYKTDTIVFNTPNARNILIGNTILPQTSNQQVAKSYGLFFKAFSVEDCEHNQSLPEPDKIVEIKRSKTEWVIKVLVYTNCCQDFLADIIVDNEDTLNLMFINYGMYCFCSCSFELTYKFRIMGFEDLKKIKYLSINGETKTKLE